MRNSLYYLFKKKERERERETRASDGYIKYIYYINAVILARYFHLSTLRVFVINLQHYALYHI